MSALNLQARRRIVEDRARTFIADHGASLLSLPRRLSGLFGATERHIRWLMLEHRLSLDGRLTPVVKRRLPEILASVDSMVGPAEAHLTLDAEDFRAIVLRAPRWEGGELLRGVLLIKFTETFRFFHHQIDIDRLMQFFRVVLEPSWSGYCLPEVLLWARYRDAVVVQASEPLDRRFLEALGTNLTAIEVGASDWVDHRVFTPREAPPRFGAIYVANLSPIKRVNVYLRAISRIVARDPGFRAAIVLSSWGSNQGAFEQMVDLYGLREHLTVLMNQTQEQLNQLLNESRVSVLVSRKEGSNKTLFESMFADTPVILLRNNIGVNKDYINEHTGRLIEERELADAILAFNHEPRDRWRPRAWAMAHISPEQSTRKLQALLAELHPGAENDVPLHAKVNTPEATYMDADIAQKLPPICDVLRCFTKVLTAREGAQGTSERLRALFAAHTGALRQ